MSVAVNWSLKVAFPSLVEEATNELSRSEVEHQATDLGFTQTAVSDFSQTMRKMQNIQFALFSFGGKRI